ncbi:MAG: pyridoxal-phosphate dependent enzyme [Gemmatimonadota bacterium]
MTRPPVPPISLDAIERARDRIGELSVRTPLIPLGPPDEDGGEIWLKLECVQPIGSFKIRGAANAIGSADPHALREGVYTASAGNMAQGVAFAARRLGVPCRVVVPDGAPRAKLDAIERLGATPVPVPFDTWWSALLNHGHPGEDGYFVHPVSHPDVVAGNATAGLEIAEDLPEVDEVIVPFGGGGLSCGIASALAHVAPAARVIACEVETAAPLRASMAAGEPRSIERTPTFVDGIGGSSVLPEMWPLVSSLIDDVEVVSIADVCEAIRTLIDSAHVVAEGAGGAAVAAALRRATPGRSVVAVVSGGNIDTDVLMRILAGECPGA